MFERAKFFVTLPVWALAVLLLVPTPATAVEIADVENVGEALVFYPTVEAHELVLTVTGPCNYKFRQRAEQELVFELDETTIDGAYTFELVAIPEIDPEILDILQGARESGDQGQVDELCRAEQLPGDPAVQSAGFTVSQGQIIFDPEAVEEGRAAGQGGETALSNNRGGVVAVADTAALSPRQVISGDLTVYNSLCVGFDCLASETYGFDTVRLKENNLRIHFEDTSTGSFPSRDWRLLANDSASGGANKFSIVDVDGNRTPFTVEAAAPNHSLYVDDGGRIGLGTSTPSVDLHVKDGDTPTLRLEQDTSSGFAAQTWDIAGNETSFFVRDATNGSTLPFRIRPGASSNSLLIDTDDDVGIGAGTSPSASLHVKRSDGSARIFVEEANATTSNRTLLEMSNKGSARIKLTNTAFSTSWVFGTPSDDFEISRDGSGASEFKLDQDGNLEITGSLTTGGTTCGGGGCDQVFRNEIETIEEHAALMWGNSYLPAVGPTVENAPFNVTHKTTAMLNELEKAHIYIDQLNGELKEKEAKIDELSERLERIEKLLASGE
jgi:hypothetical protein